MKNSICLIYGNLEGTFLANRLAKMIRKVKDDNITHLRIAEIGNLKEELSFEKVRNDSFGASIEQTFTFYDYYHNINKTFKIGFNYGH